MSMTVVVTRNVSARVRGFLASLMLEVAPGVYSAPRISPAVQQRIWEVLANWFLNEQGASIVMLWQERELPGGQAVRTLGSPPIGFVDVDGLMLAQRPLDVGD
jgi:CRISPR-associated protein Cas2